MGLDNTLRPGPRPRDGTEHVGGLSTGRTSSSGFLGLSSHPSPSERLAANVEEHRRNEYHGRLSSGLTYLLLFLTFCRSAPMQTRLSQKPSSKALLASIANWLGRLCGRMQRRHPSEIGRLCKFMSSPCLAVVIGVSSSYADREEVSSCKFSLRFHLRGIFLACRL